MVVRVGEEEEEEAMKEEGQVWGSSGTRSCPQRPQTTCSGDKTFLYLCKSKSGI